MHSTHSTTMNQNTSWLARNMTQYISHNKHCTIKLANTIHTNHFSTLYVPQLGYIHEKRFLVIFFSLYPWHSHFLLFLPLHCMRCHCPIYPPFPYLTLLSHHASFHLSSLGDNHCPALILFQFTYFTTLPPLTAQHFQVSPNFSSLLLVSCTLWLPLTHF
jgi:hypothetical protein